MKKLIAFMLFTCACMSMQAQVNFVKNPDFEQYTFCPNSFDQIQAATNWNAVDSILSHYDCRPEYCHFCGTTLAASAPYNGAFYQYPHSGAGMVATVMYCDETPPPGPPDFYCRDYLQGRLVKVLEKGKTYCLNFWLNLGEGSGYAHNNIGAYFDDGIIDTVSICSEPITFVVPQVFSSTIFDDTANWVKIEGSFVANGTEKFITIGNFFSKLATSSKLNNYWSVHEHYSYYLIDDVSVIPMDLDAQAGADTWVGLGATRKIGRIKDSATIQGLDCKWYHKGVLIDSGGIITVHANAVKGAIDTYVVVQTICGLVKTDTVLVSTVGAGMSTFATTENTFSISPNPSNGKFVISDASLRGKQSEPLSIKVYDLLGRVVYEQSLMLNKAQTPLELNLAKGTYILELRTEDAVQRERIVLE
jgi:hypothetical protein